MLRRCLAAFAFIATTATAADYTLIDLGTLGGPGSYGAAVSEEGVVVGCADVSAIAAHAFVWKDGRMQDLGTAGDGTGSSCALAVNDHGVVAGRSASGEVVVWEGGAAKRLSVRGDVGGINDRGVVVGSYSVEGTTRAFVYEGGTLLTLGTLGNDAAAATVATSINDRGVVVGRSGGRACLYDGVAMTDLGTLGGNNGGARDMNDRGIVVGGASSATGQPTAFVYRRDGMEAIDGTMQSTAIALNNRGQVVGSAEGRYGWLVDEHGVTWLGELASVASQGYRRFEPTGINDRGWIVGTATNAEGNLRAVLLVPSSTSRGKALRMAG